jgi:uncharacterized protein (TIGR00251 family)
MTDELFSIIEATPASKNGKEPERATILLPIYVQPGAGRSTVVGKRQGVLHLRVAPPPQDGRANAAVEELIADLFDVPAASASVVAGHKSRDKRLQLVGVSLEHVRAQLDRVTAKVAPGASFNPGKVQPRH